MISYLTDVLSTDMSFSLITTLVLLMLMNLFCLRGARHGGQCVPGDQCDHSGHRAQHRGQPGQERGQRGRGGGRGRPEPRAAGLGGEGCGGRGEDNIPRPVGHQLLVPGMDM